jgi:hypothetical protein
MSIESTMLFAFPPSPITKPFSSSEELEMSSTSCSSVEIGSEEGRHRKLSDVSDDVVRTVIGTCFNDESPLLPPELQFYESAYPADLVQDLDGDVVLMAMDQLGC